MLLLIKKQQNCGGVTFAEARLCRRSDDGEDATMDFGYYFAFAYFCMIKLRNVIGSEVVIIPCGKCRIHVKSR